MKKTLMIIYCLLWFVGAANAQVEISPISKSALLPAYPISVGWDHTTALVFASKVVSVDRGHGHIMAKVEEKAPNLLLLKAGQRSFKTTNLHVVTADARLYHFRVSYDESLARSSINMARQQLLSWKELQLRDFALPAKELEQTGEAVLSMDPFLNRTRRQYRMRFGLQGIYQQQGLLFFKLQVENRSRLAFVPESLVFTITDKKQAKHASVREEPLDALLQQWENSPGVPGHGQNTLVVALPQFTLSDKKQLEIQLDEKNGDRNLRLKVRGRDILKTRNLTDVQPETK
ncbi:conjugative transposon protein TraN [Echinicola rosea]|uniref:Conjugative transposon protein TraN n=1 Tax=Echinicola rosea TaxID=1807691 RepID=A0ABQ1V8N7_9BACT|nr:conjugative transposon protein TraN [Echinicola rosea]GGF42684.1 hypothetical protein GCM10011339_33960 [Echinicola rosea]